MNNRPDLGNWYSVPIDKRCPLCPTRASYIVYNSAYGRIGEFCSNHARRIVKARSVQYWQTMERTMKRNGGIDWQGEPVPSLKLKNKPGEKK